MCTSSLTHASHHILKTFPHRSKKLREPIKETSRLNIKKKKKNHAVLGPFGCAHRVHSDWNAINLCEVKFHSFLQTYFEYYLLCNDFPDLSMKN